MPTRQSNIGFHSLHEAMTADQICQLQNEHYAMDDFFRRSMGRLTLEQKKRVADFISTIIPREV